MGRGSWDSGRWGQLQAELVNLIDSTPNFAKSDAQVTLSTHCFVLSRVGSRIVKLARALHLSMWLTYLIQHPCSAAPHASTRFTNITMDHDKRKEAKDNVRCSDSQAV